MILARRAQARTCARELDPQLRFAYSAFAEASGGKTERNPFDMLRAGIREELRRR